VRQSQLGVAGGASGPLDLEELARATGSNSMISLRKSGTWAVEAFDRVTRNEWMCIIHARHRVEEESSKARLTTRCGCTYGRHGQMGTFDLQSLYLQQGQESANVVQIFFAKLIERRAKGYSSTMRGRVTGPWSLGKGVDAASFGERARPASFGSEPLAVTQFLLREKWKSMGMSLSASRQVQVSVRWSASSKRRTR